jgi:hypothetical protein
MSAVGPLQRGAAWLAHGAAVLMAASLVAWPSVASAVELPAPTALKQALAPQPVRVVEPHLSTRDRPVAVTYIGWPATVVLDRMLGAAWRASGAEVEFRALDGYVSRIPAERFARYHAWLVVERSGQASFTVDNVAQHENQVPLGPYYLVWDNIGSPELLPEGGSYWPYQVAQVLVSTARTEALLPKGMAPGFADAAALAQKYCLACHKVNGYGGDKAPGDLAQIAKALQGADFARWVLRPGEIKPGTTMPGLPTAMAEADREATARRLRDYLVAMPSTP